MEQRDPGDETDHRSHCVLCGRAEPTYQVESDGWISEGDFAGRTITKGDLVCELDVVKTLAKDGNGSFVLVHRYV